MHNGMRLLLVSDNGHHLLHAQHALRPYFGEAGAEGGVRARGVGEG